jgi:hypothetical protein
MSFISLVIKGCAHLDLPHKIDQEDASKLLPVPYFIALIISENTGPAPLSAGLDLIQEE